MFLEIVKRHWLAVTGGILWLPDIVRAIKSLFAVAGGVDLVLERSSDPKWVGWILNHLLNPPPLLSLVLIGAGVLLIRWDLKRPKTIGESGAQRMISVLVVSSIVLFVGAVVTGGVALYLASRGSVSIAAETPTTPSTQTSRTADVAQASKRRLSVDALKRRQSALDEYAANINGPILAAFRQGRRLWDEWNVANPTLTVQDLHARLGEFRKAANDAFELNDELWRKHHFDYPEITDLTDWRFDKVRAKTAELAGQLPRLFRLSDADAKLALQGNRHVDEYYAAINDFDQWIIAKRKIIADKRRELEASETYEDGPADRLQKKTENQSEELMSLTEAARLMYELASPELRETMRGLNKTANAVEDYGKTAILIAGSQGAVKIYGRRGEGLVRELISKNELDDMHPSEGDIIGTLPHNADYIDVAIERAEMPHVMRIFES